MGRSTGFRTLLGSSTTTTSTPTPVVDLTLIPLGPTGVYVGAATFVGPALTPAEMLALKQEDARQWLAALLIVLLFVIVLVVLLYFAITDDARGLTDALKLTFGPVVALIGTVVGFYFGTKTD